MLEKRSPQPNSGGKPFVLQIVDMVKNKKTHAGLDLTDENAILEHLAEWCERMCKEHGIDPGSEALQALRQQQQWYEDLKHDNSETHGMLEEQNSRCDRLEEKLDKMLKHHEKIPPSKLDDLDLMAKVLNIFKVGRMNAILQEFKVKRRTKVNFKGNLEGITARAV